MLKKQVLKRKKAYSDELICMTESNTIYVDNKFYKDKMQERLDDPECGSFPVKVVALRMGWFLKTPDEIDGRYFLQEILRNEDLSYYNLKSLRMVIEFLYKNIKFTIVLLQLPAYLSNLLFFVVVAILNESVKGYYLIDEQANLVQGTANSRDMEDWLGLFITLNSISATYLLVINFFMLRMMGVEYFTRFWSLIDLLIAFISASVGIQFLVSHTRRDENGYYMDNYQEYKDRTIVVRIYLMFGQFILFSKSQYFLSLFDNVAPLINIFFQIFYDIVGFIVVMILLIITASFVFYILGQNQLNFDGLTKEESDEIPYLQLQNSFTYIGQMLIGETDASSFYKGEARMAIPLTIVFVLFAFATIIHFLNMLIAIMGNTFTIGNETMEQQKYKEHLRFIIDNWFLREMAFENLDQVKYIITTFSTIEDDDDDPLYQEIRDDIVEKTDGIAQVLKKQDDKIKDIQRMLTKLIKRMDPDG